MPLLQNRVKHNLALTVGVIAVLAGCAPLNRVPETQGRVSAGKAAYPAAVPAASAVVAAPLPVPPVPIPGPGELRRYADVITKDAKTSRGMLLHHKVKDRHFFEIPEKLLGRDLLWSAEISQASAGGGFNGLPLGYRVLRFERVENRIFLRSVSFQNRSIGDIKAAADAVDLAPIVMAFQIEAEGNELSVELRAEEKAEIEKARTEKPDIGAADKAHLEKEKYLRDAAESIRGYVAAGTGDDALAITVAAVEAANKTSVEKPASADAIVSASATAPAKAESKATAADKPASRGTVEVAAKRPSTKEKWPVIDATRILRSTSSDLIDARNLGPTGFGGVDPSRSLIGQVKVFPTNVEARSTLTFAS
ncbi:MAG: DUF5118 domain-containing protein, partial [Rhodocyclaceae bacterium]|nr:DUF5118 domain-containing protein [Rhodocyclaceae bacterium]